MKLKPMADNVLLKQNEAQETTASGIILATTTKEKPAIYEVVAVGPGTKDVVMEVKAGDKVTKGSPVCVIEALKMENDVPAPADGVVASVNVKSGDSVKTDEVLLTLN